MKKIITLCCSMMVIMMLLVGCRESRRVSYNVSQEADNFNIMRRVYEKDFLEFMESKGEYFSKE